MDLELPLDISAKDLLLLQNLLQKYLPEVTAWAFGSRVKGKSRPSSDLDLVVFSSPAQNRAFHDLKEALQESALPFRVDLLVWDDLPETFHKVIEQDKVVIA